MPVPVLFTAIKIPNLVYLSNYMYHVLCFSQESYSIRPKFTDNSHIGYIKAIAASPSFLASGSTDETIHLYNLRTNTELGTLLQHDGKINYIVIINVHLCVFI